MEYQQGQSAREVLRRLHGQAKRVFYFLIMGRGFSWGRGLFEEEFTPSGRLLFGCLVVTIEKWSFMTYHFLSRSQKRLGFCAEVYACGPHGTPFQPPDLNAFRSVVPK
jgi:hypothetical protein